MHIHLFDNQQRLKEAITNVHIPQNTYYFKQTILLLKPSISLFPGADQVLSQNSGFMKRPVDIAINLREFGTATFMVT